MEFAVNPQQAAAAAEQSDAAAGEFASVRQQFASIVERAAEASGDLGIKGRCLAYHDEWSRVITEIEHRGSATGTDLAAVTAEAVRTGDEVAGDFGSIAESMPDTGINRAING